MCSLRFADVMVLMLLLVFVLVAFDTVTIKISSQSGNMYNKIN